MANVAVSHSTVGSASNALLVTLPSTDSLALNKSVFNIATTFNEPDPSHPFFGVASIVDPIKKGADGYGFLSGTVAGEHILCDHTEPSNDTQHCGEGKKPSTSILSTSKTPSLGESKIWKLDCRSHHLLIDWINQDGSHFPATFFFFPDAQVNVSHHCFLLSESERRAYNTRSHVRQRMRTVLVSLGIARLLRTIIRYRSLTLLVLSCAIQAQDTYARFSLTRISSSSRLTLVRVLAHHEIITTHLAFFRFFPHPSLFLICGMLSCTLEKGKGQM